MRCTLVVHPLCTRSAPVKLSRQKATGATAPLHPWFGHPCFYHSEFPQLIFFSTIQIQQKYMLKPQVGQDVCLLHVCITAS